MAWALVQSKKATSATSTTATITVAGSFASSVTSGDRIILYTNTTMPNAGADVSTPTDNQLNTYSKVVTSNTGGSGNFATIWTAVASSTGTLTITVVTSSIQASGAELGWTAEEYSGLDGSAGTGSVDKTAAGTGNQSSTANAASGTTLATTAANQLAVSLVTDWGATATWTVSAGGFVKNSLASLDADANAGIGVANKTSASGATEVCTWTNGGAIDTDVSVVAVFKLAAVGTAVTYKTAQPATVRDPSEVPWIQKDRRNANLVATAANPLVPPLDSAWQAGSRYWHLYQDAGNTAPRTWQSLQRSLRSDPSMLVPPVGAIPYTAPRLAIVRDPSETPWQQRNRAGAPPSRKFFVKTGGSDGADGLSDATAWASIAKVNATTLQPGDMVQFRGGDSFGGNVAPTTSGTASFPITYTSYGTGRATITTTGTDAFSFVNVGGFEVRSLILVGDATAKGNGSAGVNGYASAGNGKRAYLLVDSCDSSSFSHGVIIGGDTTSEGFSAITLTNNTCHANRDDGIALWGGAGGTAFSNSNATIVNNVCSGNLGNSADVNPTGSGIVVGSTNTALIDLCTAHDNGGSNNASGGPVGIWCYDSTAITIQRCLSYSNKTAGATDGGGFDLDINVSNSTVQYCFAYSNDGPGFMCFASGTAVYTGNTIRYCVSRANVRNTSLPATTYGEMLIAGTVANTTLYGNTVYATDNASNNISALVVNATPTGVTIRNNIFQSQAAVTVLAGSAWAIAAALCQGNDYYRSSGTQIKWGATTYTTLAAWRAAVVGQEVVSAANTGLTVDPVFVDPTTTPVATDANTMTTAFTGLQVQGSSPMLTAGQDMLGTFGVDPGSRDFWGDTLAVPLSIGADEFVPVSFDPVLDAWPWRWLTANRAALYVDRREVPQQRSYFDPALLRTALLENELLGGAGTSRRYNQPASCVDRREVPQQRLYVSDPLLLLTAQLDELLGGADTAKRYNQPASSVDRREVPQQRLYVSDPLLLSSAQLENELLGGADTAKRYNQPASCVDRREVPQQRLYVSDPLLLLTAELENELLGGAGTWQRYNEPATNVDRREVPQQRLYVSSPSSALLENELLGGADTSKRYNQPATNGDRREVPQQRLYVSDPLLLLTALLENELLGGGDTAKRYNQPASSVDRREVPQQRAYVSDPLLLLPPVPFDPTLAAWPVSWLNANRAGTHTDRREVPQQRAYLSDPSFYPTIPPTDPLTVAWGAGGGYWHLYNRAGDLVDRREVPQQRPYVSDPRLLLTALLENELLGGAGTLARYLLAATNVDRREVPQQRAYVSDPSFYPAGDPLTIAWGAGGSYWHLYNRAGDLVDRREVPQQRLYVSDPLLLLTAQLENELLGGAGTSQRYSQPATNADRREVPQQRAYVSDPLLYLIPPVDPLTVAWGAGGRYWHLYHTPETLVDRRLVPSQRRYISDPLLLATALLENELLGGADDLRRRYGMAAYYDRRQVPQQRVYSWLLAAIAAIVTEYLTIDGLTGASGSDLPGIAGLGRSDGLGSGSGGLDGGTGTTGMDGTGATASGTAG